MGRYAEAQRDPELGSVREEIALIDARLADVLSRVDTGESAALWTALGDALADGDLAEAQRLASAGRADWGAWAAVLDLVERRRKLVETEVGRLVKLGQAITAERAALLLASVADIVRRHVTDREALSGISREISQLADVRTLDAAERSKDVTIRVEYVDGLPGASAPTVAGL
jgi:hypothetical protein